MLRARPDSFTLDGMHPLPGVTSESTLADRAYRQTSAVGIWTGVLWSCAWALLGMPWLAAVGSAGIMGMITARVMRRRLGYPAATRVSVLCCYAVIIVAILRTGGMDGPFGVALLILPLGPALALGAAECMRWGGIVLATGLLLWGYEAGIGPIPDLMMPGTAGLMRGMTQFSVLAATLACLYTYGRMHELSRARLRGSRGELEAANRELQLSQQKLIVSEKMAALGRLSAGMAHEINSTLAGAINSVELARSDAESLAAELRAPAPDVEAVAGHSAEIRDSLELAATALEKTAAFVRRMRGQTAVVEVDPDRLFSPVEEAATVLRLLQVGLMERRVGLRSRLEDSSYLRGDPARFGQIVQNLVANAVDAYEGAPGAVDVRIAREGGCVVVEVADEGAGIAPEIRGRIFEHFFTTKGVGGGTGLGLALVHDLATDYFGGTIDFESEVGRGTRFIVRLPAAEQETV